MQDECFVFSENILELWSASSVMMRIKALTRSLHSKKKPCTTWNDLDIIRAVWETATTV